MASAFGAEGEEESIDAMDIDEPVEEREYEEESLGSSEGEEGIDHLRISLDKSRVIDLDRLLHRNNAVYAMSADHVGSVYLANTIQELAGTLTALFGQGKYSNERMVNWKVSLVTAKPGLDKAAFLKELKYPDYYSLRTIYFDDRLADALYQINRHTTRIERKRFSVLFDIHKTWFLDHRLITEFLRDIPDDQSDLQNIDERRIQTSYHSAGSWRFVSSSVSMAYGEHFKNMQLLTNSQNRFFTHIEAFKNRPDRVDLYFNDQMHMDYDRVGRKTYLEPVVRLINQERFKTRPSNISIEFWMHVLHAMRNQDNLTNKERAAAIDYLITMLFMSQSLLSDPQGRSFFVLMARPHISATEKIRLKRLLSTAQAKNPSTLVTFVSSNAAADNGQTLTDLVDDETMDLLCGLAAFINSEAPLLGDIKQSSMHAHLFPLVTLETARANSPESFGLGASVLYPFRTGGTRAENNESSQPNLDLELDYIRLLHFLSHHEAPMSGLIRILPAKYIGRETNFELLDVRRIFPEYHIEALSGNAIQLVGMLSTDQVIFFAWHTLRESYRDLDLPTFISKGFCDRYIAALSTSINDPREDEFWAPLVLRAYHDFKGAPKSLRLNLLYDLTRAVSARYGGDRPRAFRISQSTKNTFATILDTDSSMAEATGDRLKMLRYLRDYWVVMTSRDLTSLYYERYLVDLQPYWLNIDAAVSAVKQYSREERLYPSISNDLNYVSFGRWIDEGQISVGQDINEWSISKRFEFPFLFWTCQFSVALPRELFKLNDDRIARLAPLFKTSAQTWLPMGVRGLTKPKWHLMMPTDLLLSFVHDQESQQKKKKTVGVDLALVADAKNLSRGDTFQDFFLQHFLMLFPHNYYLLFLISNGVFDKAYDYIVRSNVIISGDRAENNAFFKELFLLRMDGLVRNRGLVPMQLEDVIMATFVIGLGVRNAIEPGYLDTLEKRIDVEDIFNVFFDFTSSDDKVFRFLPGTVAFTEAARIGHPKLLDLLFYGPKHLKNKDKHSSELSEYISNRSGSLKQYLRLTAPAICYYTLPPPYRLMTPWNLIQTHQLVAQVQPVLNTSQPIFDSHLLDVFQDLDVAMATRFPVIDVGVRFTQHVQNLVSERAEREARQLGGYTPVQRRLRSNDIASLVRSMQAESQHNHPMFYGPNSTIDLDPSKDHIYWDDVHYLPFPNQYDDEDAELPVLGEPEDADKSDDTELPRINTLLIKMTALMRGGVDADLMLASHRRMWQNLHLAALKKAELTPTPLQIAFPFGVGQPGEEEGEEGGFLPSVSSPIDTNTQPYIPAYAPLLNLQDIEKELIGMNQEERERRTKLPFGAGNSDEVSGDDDDNDEGEESMVEHDEDVDLSEYQDNKKQIAERNKGEDLSSSSDMSLEEEEEEEEEDSSSSSSSSESTSGVDFPKRRQLEYLQTWEDIKVDVDNKWYYDIVRDQDSTANLIISATSELLNTEIRRVMRSLISTLAIPVTLGLIAHRVRNFVSMIVTLKKGYTLSHVSETKTRELREHLASRFSNITRLHFDSIWKPLLTGLEMLSDSDTMLSIILSGLCNALKTSILTTARPTEENKALMTEIDINQWIERSIKRYKAEGLKATAKLEKVETMNENELAFRLRPWSLSKPNEVIEVDVPSSGTSNPEEEEATRNRDETQRLARATLESVTFLQKHIAIHRTTESSLEPSILTFAQDLVTEFEIGHKKNRSKPHPMFDIDKTEFTTHTMTTAQERTAVETLCKAPLYTAGAAFVSDTLNHYISERADRIILDVLFQSMDTAVKTWVNTMRAFVVSRPNDDNSFDAVAHGAVFDALFNTVSKKGNTKLLRHLAILNKDDATNYDALTEALIVLLFGSTTERKLSNPTKPNIMTSLEKLAASCLIT